MKARLFGVSRLLAISCVLGSLLALPAHALTNSGPDIIVPNLNDKTISRIVNVTGGDYVRLPLEMPAGDEPAYIAAGDFNSDGLRDLIIVNPSPGQLEFMLGKGNGSFERLPNPLNFGFQISATLGVGDFNNDGLLDFLVSFNGNSVQLWLANDGNLNGDPNAHFTAQTPVVIGSRANAVAVADFNKDGNLDAVVCDYSGGTVILLAGNGAGILTNQLTLNAGSAPEDIRVGDFNADGKTDFAVAGGLSQYVSVYLGNGNGTFAPELQVTTRTGGDGTYYLAVGDLNNDGYDDIITRGGSSSLPTLDVLLWDPANANFVQSITPIPIPNVWLSGISVADMNGDGNQDVLFPNSPVNNTLSIYFGDGTGHLGSVKNLDTGGLPNSLAIVDINPVLNDYTETVRFHNKPDGYGNVNSFSTNDTLYIVVNDVKVSQGSIPATAEVTLLQKGQVISTSTLKARPDGSYVAAVKLSGLGLGEARVKIQLTFLNDANEAFYNLIRNSKIKIKNVVINFEQFTTGQVIPQVRGVFPDFKISFFSDRGLPGLTAQADTLLPVNILAHSGFSSLTGSDVVNVIFNRSDIDTGSIKVNFRSITDVSGKTALVFDNLSYSLKDSSDPKKSSLIFGQFLPALGGPAVLTGPNVVEQP